MACDSRLDPRCSSPFINVLCGDDPHSASSCSSRIVYCWMRTSPILQIYLRAPCIILIRVFLTLFQSLYVLSCTHIHTMHIRLLPSHHYSRLPLIHHRSPHHSFAYALLDLIAVALTGPWRFHLHLNDYLSGLSFFSVSIIYFKALSFTVYFSPSRASPI